MKYRARPVIVKAYKIVSVAGMLNADTTLDIALDNGENYVASSQQMARMTPREGDYLVRQEDGYEYLNPKDVFERKYELVKEGETI